MADDYAPRRPRLRPGFAPYRRDDRTWQIGLHPPHRVLVPDDAAVRRLLNALTDPTVRWSAPTTPAALRAWEDLLAAGMVLAGQAVHLRRDHEEQHGPAWTQRITSRRRATVLASGPVDLVGALRDLLGAEGLPVSTYQPGRDSVPEPTSVWVALSAGPISRDLLDQAPGASLSVAFAEGRCEIGPFTLPGQGPCLRCVDAARCDNDPRWPLLIEQASASPRQAPSLELVSTRLALTLTAQEVLTWVDGNTPATWGATVAVTPHGLPVRTTWARHHACGCTWQSMLNA